MKSIFLFITALFMAANIHASTNKTAINKNTINKIKKVSSNKIQPTEELNIPLHTSENLKEVIRNQIDNIKLLENDQEPIKDTEEIDQINEIKKIWEESKPVVSDDDIVIQQENPTLFVPDEHLTPPETINPIHIEKNQNNKKTENKNPSVKINVQLRHPPVDKSKKIKKENNKDKPVIPISKKTIPVITVPTTPSIKPVLTRRQVLEQEIGRERVALNSAKSQLNAAKKAGNVKQINKLNNLIKDRELNIQSIQKEMMR